MEDVGEDNPVYTEVKHVVDAGELTEASTAGDILQVAVDTVIGAVQPPAQAMSLIDSKTHSPKEADLGIANAGSLNVTDQDFFEEQQPVLVMDEEMTEQSSDVVDPIAHSVDAAVVTAAHTVQAEPENLPNSGTHFHNGDSLETGSSNMAEEGQSELVVDDGGDPTMPQSTVGSAPELHQHPENHGGSSSCQDPSFPTNQEIALDLSRGNFDVQRIAEFIGHSAVVVEIVMRSSEMSALLSGTIENQEGKGGAHLPPEEGGKINASGSDGDIARMREQGEPSLQSIHTKIKAQSSYVCGLCQKEFSSATAVKQHFKIHNGEKKEECSICGKRFTQTLRRKRHELRCQQRPYRCEYCIACFDTAEKWEQHVARHRNLPGHRCDLCDVSYIHRSTLNKHMRSKHPGHNVKPHARSEDATEEETPPWKECRFCKETFEDIESSRDHATKKHPHAETEFTGKRFKCEHCPQLFATSRGKTLHHRNSHPDEKSDGRTPEEKRYQCELCGKLMKANNANYHRRTHSGERPFKCETCGKSFTSSQSLKEHSRVHSGEKPFKCRFCTMRFTAAGSRVRHERQHTGEMPYECSYCGKRFRALSGFDVHQRGHTGATPYHCRFCKDKFTYKYQLDMHEESYHTDDIKSDENNKVCGSGRKRKQNAPEIIVIK